MEYTKGEWEIKIDKEPACITIVSNKGYKIATIHPFGAYREMPNAHLIAAAVNACIKVNPDNPMAVAQSIEDLYEALKQILIESVITHEHMKDTQQAHRLHISLDTLINAKQAIAKAEEK